MYVIGINHNNTKAENIINSLYDKKNIELDIKTIDKYTFFSLSSSKKKRYTNINLKSDIKDIIYKLITEIVFIDKIDKYTKIKLRAIGEDDRNLIKEQCLSIIKDEDLFKLEKSNLKDIIYDFLTYNNLILLDGFTEFRLRDYKDLLNLISDLGIGKYSADKEYQEFIILLQDFVHQQESNFDYINVIMRKNNNIFLDENYNDISKDYYQYILDELDHEEFNQIDILISVLIVLSPKKIKLHLGSKSIKSSGIDSIKKIFQDRVEVCYGCSHCNKANLNKES